MLTGLGLILDKGIYKFVVKLIIDKFPLNAVCQLWKHDDRCFS